MFCARQTVTYSYGLSSAKPKQINFRVRGSSNAYVTYWFQMVLGYNFLTSSGMKVFLRRTDEDVKGLSDLECLYDKSCVEAHMSSKNELKIDVFLTQGDYVLALYDDGMKEVKDFL